MPIDIIQKFANLDDMERFSLCESLYDSGSKAFKAMVTALWPDTGKADIIRLENFVDLMKRTAV